MPAKIDPSKFRDVVCPYFPPVMTPDPLNLKAVRVNYGQCLGPVCALWDSCQGDFSPKANGQRLALLIKGLEPIVKVLEAKEPEVKSLREALASIYMMFKASFSSQKPQN